jgi:hypothetical protein
VPEVRLVVAVAVLFPGISRSLKVKEGDRANELNRLPDTLLGTDIKADKYRGHLVATR